MVYNRYKWEERTKETKEIPIPPDISAIKTSQKGLFILHELDGIILGGPDAPVAVVHAAHRITETSESTGGGTSEVKSVRTSEIVRDGTSEVESNGTLEMKNIGTLGMGSGGKSFGGGLKSFATGKSGVFSPSRDSCESQESLSQETKDPSGATLDGPIFDDQDKQGTTVYEDFGEVKVDSDGYYEVVHSLELEIDAVDSLEHTRVPRQSPKIDEMDYQSDFRTAPSLPSIIASYSKSSLFIDQPLYPNPPAEKPHVTVRIHK